MSLRASLRLVWFGFYFHFKSYSRSGFELMVAITWPLVLASIAFFMFRAGHREGALFDAALGASVMGIWSIAVSAAGNAIQWQRWLGTLESLVAAPAPFALTLLSITLAMASLGVYSVAATLLWGRLLFGIQIHLVHPIWFLASVPFVIGSIGVFGFLLAASCVLYRTAWALSVSFEFPGWLLTGVLVPFALLPAWVRPLSWLLAPTWGMRALRASSDGGDPLRDIGLCALLSAAYLGAGVVFLRHLLQRARVHATFSLT